MFGVICAGRPVQTNLQQVDENRYVFQINNGARVNHLVVFVLPDAVIPQGMAACVYFQLPGKDFELLGALSDTKPSSIFKINTGFTGDVDMEDKMMDDDSSNIDQFDINIGISIEPMMQAEQLLAQQKAAAAAAAAVKKPAALAAPGAGATPAPEDAQSVENLANKIVSHAYNYLSGFTTPDNKVSMKVFDDWWQKFKTKLATNPKFLQNLE